MEIRPRSHSLAMVVCWLLVVFLVLFPKGGFRFGGIPITWGYIFLGGTFPLLLGVRIFSLPLRFPRGLLAVALMLLPLQFLFFYAYMINGVVGPSFALSTFINLFVLPFVFLFVYAPFLPLLDGRKLSSYLRMCILLAAVWGIFLFILHPLTGHFIEIPLLTSNLGDTDLEGTKDISRGFFFKLISTYNNGNLYGASTLILLPMYSVLEPVRWRRALVMLALFLTLSRSVWVGILVYEALPVLYDLALQARNFPRLDVSKIGKQLAVVGGTVVIVLAVSFYLVSSSLGLLGFLLDPTGGGRLAGITGYNVITFLPSAPLGGFPEILYVGALQDFGIAGFLSFTLFMVSPVLLLLMDSSALASPMRRAALKGLVVYSVLAWLDGAFDYIPVMAFYWFTYMIYLFGWPAFQASSARLRRGSAALAGGPSDGFSAEPSGA